MTEPVDSIVLPLYDEKLSVSRREVETDVIKVETVTHQHDALVDEALTHHRVEIVRVPVGRTIDTVPPTRQEGDTTIIPVVEEMIVIEKRLVLKEEVHLRRIQVTEQHRETVALRKQEAVVTRGRIDATPPNSDA